MELVWVQQLRIDEAVQLTKSPVYFRYHLYVFSFFSMHNNSAIFSGLRAQSFSASNSQFFGSQIHVHIRVIFWLRCVTVWYVDGSSA